MRKTKSKTFSLKSRTTSLILALLLLVSIGSVGFASIASAVEVDDDSGGGLAATGATTTDEFTAGVSTGDDSNKAFWVDATYYDYLSDTERDSGGSWLNPKQAGTNFNGSDDDWYEFYTFNNDISYVASQSGANWDYPLYFGNFCNKVNQGTDYVTTSYDSDHDGPYNHAINGLKNYEYYINNSNGLTGENGVSGYHYSITGLAAEKLDSSMNLQYTEGKQMPYFNSEWVRSSNRGRVINSSFPFRTKTTGTLTTYSFDSQGAKDNVFFNWNGSTPQTVGYGQGRDDNGNEISGAIAKYGVKDGIQYFMDPELIDVDTGKRYKETNYYGIFPFNRANTSNGGNNKLDYGFGIKMNMDFRVPKDGKNGSTPIKFNYSGDDDLWVYITPYKSDGSLDTNNSQLVLDLGGNHKKATGEIDFSTMVATADHSYHASHNVDFRPDLIYIKNNGVVAGQDSTPISNRWIYLWKKGTNTKKWYKYDTSADRTVNGTTYMTISTADVEGYDHFLITNNKPNSDNDWSNVTMQTKDSKEASGYFGNVTYTNNLEWITEQLPDYKRDGTVTKNFGFVANGTDGSGNTKYKTLDPDKTYRMTIFYMERGMLESNCMMSFTMTPVKNDLKVKKIVDVSEINTDTSSNGLRTAIQQLPFDFTTSEGGSVRKDTKFVRNQEWYSVDSSTGVYQLKHNELADFNNQHETGSTLQVNETTPSGLTYTTSWEVVDNNNNANVLSHSVENQSSLGTGDFTLIDPRNASAPANLQVNFTNKPTAAPSFTISKSVFFMDPDKTDSTTDDWEDYLLDGDDAPDDEFSFTLLLNLKGQEYSSLTARDFKGYNMTYSLTRNGQTTTQTATNGQFTLRAGDVIDFAGLPMGATYHLTEAGCAGFSSAAYETEDGDVHRYAEDANGEINGTVSDGLFFDIYNVGAMSGGSFAVQKTIQSGSKTTQYKNGDLFTFRAKGLGSVVYDNAGHTSIDATAQTAISDTQDYVEVSSADSNGLVQFNPWDGGDSFLSFNHAGVYVFEVWEAGVNSTDNKLKDVFKSNTQRFLVKFTVTATGENLVVGDPEYFTYDGGTVNAASFSKKVTSATFVNEVKTGKIKINKKDGKGSGLGGVQFKLYRKGETTEIATLTTNASGYVEKDGLDVFKSVTGTPVYQEYVLKETSTKNGHILENTVYTFSFPQYDSQAQAYKYEYTFDYVNAALKQPDTGSFGMFSNMPLGIALIFLSFVSVGLFIAKQRKKQLMTAHRPRFY